MLHINFVEIENHLAYEMLTQILINPNIKQALNDISLVLISNILTPIREKLVTVERFSDLPDEYQEIIKNLATGHSAEGRQYGAVMPEVASSKEIICSIDNILNFLNELENVLREIDKVTSIDQLAIVLKIIFDLGHIYYFGSSPIFHHHFDFEHIKNLISRTPEENDIRLLRTEVGEQPKFALTHGIGTTEKDLGLSSRGEGRIAGKSIFGRVDMKAWLERLCIEFDETQSVKLAEKMLYYKIPLKKSEREPINVYAKKLETFFEKLIKKPQTQAPLPLIAGVSGSTAKVLVTLQDLGAFNKFDGSFDFEKAQIIANCLMGFLVHAGHHSTVEVAEVYNRLLDYIAIDNLEKNGPLPELVETKMPYYHVGNYHSFFNKSYADKIIGPEQNYDLQFKSVINRSV